MNAEKIYTRENGNKVKITARVSASSFESKAYYSVRVETCEKGKRSWFGVYSGDDYFFRKLSLIDRQLFIDEAQLKHVTPAEILEVKMMVWQKLKPE